MKLTKTELDALVYNGNGRSSQVRWDESVAPGFGVRILPSGTKTFVLKYRHRGKPRWYNIGRYGPITLVQASKRAREVYLEIKAGKDPQGERGATKLGVTLEAFSKTYMKRHAKARKRSWEKDEQLLRIYILPKLGKQALADITRSKIANFHADVGQEQPTTANRCLALLSKMFNEAIKWGALPETAANPARGVEKFKEISRDRFLDPKELPALAAAINREGIYIRGYFWLLLLTGLRKGELRTLKWADVDLDEGRLRIGKTKSGKPHYLPLSPPAITVLKAIPREHENPYVFCGMKKGKPLVDLKKPWERIIGNASLQTLGITLEDIAQGTMPETVGELPPIDAEEFWETIHEKAGFSDLRIHDLRRTVGSWMAQHGHSLALIGRVLNHSSPQVTQVYARFSDAPVQKAMEEHGKLLEGVIEIGADA